MAKTTKDAKTGDATKARGGQDASVAPLKPDVPTAIASAPGTPAQSSAAASAIEALSADHRRVEQLFADYESAADDKRKDELLRQICMELIVHTRLEEEIFYRACRDKASDDEPLDEAQVEHDSAKLLIADLMEAPSSDHFRDAKVTVLSEQIKHHVAEEEKPGDGIFAQAKARGLDTADLANRLKQRKEELQGRAAELRPTRAVSLNLDFDQEERMARNYGNGGRERDERGRFTSDDDDRDYRRSSGRNGDLDRDERGRFMSDDDEGYRSFGRRGSSRDERGRFADDDDRERGSFGRGGGFERDERGRFVSDDDGDHRRSQGRSGGGRYGDDDDDRGRGRGWYGDSEGHSEAARRGRPDDEDDRRGSRSRGGRDDDDDYRGGGRGRGWYGDSEGHAEAARRGRSDDDDDDRGGRSRSREDEDDRGGRGRGWYGDSEGHAEAARHRGESWSRGRNDEDDRRRGSSSRGRSDESHGGWFGDPRRHAQAARRGWEHRR